jgi:signal-transduction protein with cAMP-binding, CBS, and nucleotidyltransferase domain
MTTIEKALAVEDLDNLFNAVLADTEALEDAKMTLEVIKKTQPDVYDEIINSSIALIDKALSNSIMSTIANILDDENWYLTNGSK